MLKKISPPRAHKGGRIAIVAAKFNSKYVDALVRSAREELKSSPGVELEIFRVPGSFEVPVVAARLASGIKPKFDSIICFGVILRGETTHAQQVADAVSFSLAQIQVNSGIPVIHGVLLFENEDQAKVRCLGKEHNRGIEAARVALDMSTLMRKLNARVTK